MDHHIILRELQMFSFSGGWGVFLSLSHVVWVSVWYLHLYLSHHMFRDLKRGDGGDLSSSSFYWFLSGSHLLYKILGPPAVSCNSTIYQKVYWGAIWKASAGRCSFYFTHAVNDTSAWFYKSWFMPLPLAVKSKDSGIQNSADGSREMLATTASNTSLTDAGETQTSVIT